MKNVVKSIEKQKKQKSARGEPLADRTSHHLNSTSQLERITNQFVLPENPGQILSYHQNQENLHPAAKQFKRVALPPVPN